MDFVSPSTPLAGKAVLIPIVSAGNVSQLAVDLIIHSLGLQKIAIVNQSFFIPVVGAREDGRDGIVTPLELYGKDGLDIVVMQQRSPVLKSQKVAFIDSLRKYLLSADPSAILFLSGMDLSNRTDRQMAFTTCYITPRGGPELKKTILEPVLHLLPAVITTSTIEEARPSFPSMPGSGLTRRILEAFSTVQVPTAIVLQYVAEGDNSLDAEVFAENAKNILGLSIPEWKKPPSWTKGLFGAPHDQTLYG